MSYPRRVIGGYEILEEVGRGAVGLVYRARSPSGGDVAVKVLKDAGPEALGRFERERRILALFTESEGFVPLVDSGVSPAGPYLVMPFMPGGTLRRRLERGVLAVEAVVGLGRDLADALGRAHSRGIVHRDLKPENVLFTAEGRPLVADLGLAKHFGRDASGTSLSLSGTGVLRGTAAYMAPEQAVDAKSVAPSADVFALGAVLYECLAGRPAFEGESLLDVLGKVARGTFTPIRRQRPDVPPWLAEVIERALAHDPSARFQDGLLLKCALERRRRSRSWRPAGVVVFLVAGAGGFTLHGSTVRVEPRAQPSPRPGREDAPGKPTPRPPRSPGDEKRREWLSSAGTTSRPGDLAGTIAVLDAAIRRDPANADLWIRRAAARVEGGETDGAIDDATRAIDLDARSARAWTSRSVIKRRRRDLDGAISDATRAIELEAAEPLVWEARGSARLERGDVEGAITDFARVAELAPTDALAWCNLAAARGGARDFDGAIADSTKALDLDPLLPSAWMLRGVARSRLEREGAIDDLSRYLELAPDSPEAPAVRGWLETLRARAR